MNVQTGPRRLDLPQIIEGTAAISGWVAPSPRCHRRRSDPAFREPEGGGAGQAAVASLPARELPSYLRECAR